MSDRLSQRQRQEARLVRLTALLQQANEMLIGCGQYVPDGDPNRRVLEEVVRTNNVVVAEEQEAQRIEESPILTLA